MTGCAAAGVTPQKNKSSAQINSGEHMYISRYKTGLRLETYRSTVITVNICAIITPLMPPPNPPSRSINI